MMNSRLLHSALAVSLVAVLGNEALADKLKAKAQSSGSLFEIDTSTGVVTDLGMTGFQLVSGLKRHPNTQLWGLQPGLLNGYTLLSVDESTGMTSPIQSFTTSSSGSYGMAIDPTGARVYTIATKGLLPAWDLVELEVATGIPTTRSFGTFAAGVRGLTFGGDGQLYALHIEGSGTTKLVAVNIAVPASSSFVGTNLGAAFNGSMGVELVRDAGSGKTYAYSRATKQLFDLDLSSGTASNPVTLQTGADLYTIAGSGCGGGYFEFGSGCPGSGGFVPDLSTSGAPCEGNTIEISIDNALGGGMATLLLGFGSSNLPLGGGCTLHAFPLLPSTLSFPLFGAGPGQGFITLAAQVPVGVAGLPLVLQSYVIDPGSPLGAAFTDAVIVTFG